MFADSLYSLTQNAEGCRIPDQPKDIRRPTRQQHPAEEKIRIVLDG
ncbi:hypothetical protein [Cribrihabitans neustonicus]